MSSHCDKGHDHGQHWWRLIRDEIVCHLPCAIFSVAGCLAVLSLFSTISPNAMSGGHGGSGDLLFHSFHFIHIVFAATSTLVTFFRRSRNVWRGLAVGILSPMIFCSLSDVVIPYLAGSILGTKMHFHLCFISEITNVLPFLFAGLVNGFVVGFFQKDGADRYMRISHAAHIVISSFASGFYLVSHGFQHWHNSMGALFIFLIIAVVVPCTLSDVVAPLLFAREGGNKGK